MLVIIVLIFSFNYQYKICLICYLWCEMVINVFFDIYQITVTAVILTAINNTMVINKETSKI